MKKIILLFIVLFMSQVTFAQWQDLNSGITDTLTDIVFFGDQGVVTSDNGVYYTLNGGDGSANWQRFEITGNAPKALLYANTEFTGGFSNPNNSQSEVTFYFVGEDVVNNKAVLMSLELPTLNYNIISLDLPNSRLNDIKYGKEFNKYYAVGTNGLLLTFTNDIATHIIINTNVTDDFTAISFNTSGYLAQIGSINKYFRLNSFTNGLDEYSTPGETHNDLTSIPYSVNDKYMRHSFTNMIVYSEYDYGPINGNTILASANRNFVGTDHGIFISNTDKDVLQWQPSSGNANIKALWRISNAATMYACGENGIIMKNESASDEAKPYVRILFDGGCISESTYDIDSVTGDTDSCAWYIDNVLVSTNCDSFTYPFSTVGTYTVRLVATFNGLTTQTIKTVHIVNAPQIDKPFNVVDEILCHEESIQIEISNSEPNVVYTLHRDNSNAIYGTSDVGNGGTVTLNSIPVNETATFVLKSANVNARACARAFTDTFEIIVEQTEANFHVGLLNATTNEDVTFHQTSADASSFDWSFTTAANALTTTGENPTNSFNTTGVHDVTLTASSVNQCVDDITLSSPNIYEEPAETNECWSYINQSESPVSLAYYQDISHITEVTDGYLTGGTYRNELFGTNHGVGYDLNESRGGFLSKSDDKGILKWLVYTKGPNNSTVFSSAEDLNGNIYLAINSNDCEFFDNSGKIITFDKGGNIIKLNSKGELIWYMAIRTFTPTGLTVDNNNDLLIYGNYDIYEDTQHDVYLNDSLVDEVGTIIFPTADDRFCNGIIKATPDGNILWDNEIFSTSGTFGVDQQTRYIGVDANNNYYVSGQYKNHMYIYHTGSTASTDLDYHQYYAGGSIYEHVFKLNTDGALQWTTRSYVTDSGLYKAVFHHDVKTDTDGNTFILGSSNYGGASFNHIHNVENADGSTFSSDEALTYFLKKINANGFVEWILGTEETNSSNSIFPVGWQLEVKNGVVTTIGKIKANITTPENVMFKSSNDELVTPALTANDLFVNSYSISGVLNKVTVFNSVIEDPYNITYEGLISKDLDNYYLGSNFGSTFSDRDGQINFLNSEFCGTIYNSSLSVEDFENNISIVLVPNPNNGNFKLSIDHSFSKCKVAIYNLLGQLMSEEEFTITTDIPLKINGSSGIYIAEISIDNTYKKSIKVIVK